MRARRWLIGMCALSAASVAGAWFAMRRQPEVLLPAEQGRVEEQGWPAGSCVRWVDEPYVEQRGGGERCEVRRGDEGTVLMDDSPTEFLVTFPATGAFCPPRSSVVLVERAAIRDK